MTKVLKMTCPLCGLRASPNSLLKEHPFEVFVVEYLGGGIKGQRGGGTITWTKTTDQKTLEGIWFVLQKRLRQLASNTS